MIRLAQRTNQRYNDDLCNQINDVTYSIEQSETALIEYENQIRQLNWDKFDELQERISQITDESDFLIELMENDNLYDDHGQLTDEGLATMGLHAVNYDTYLAQAQDYAAEIAEIDEGLASDPYNQDLIDRREELLELQQEMILAAEDEKEAIVDMVEEGIELELDSLQDLIDQYEDALDAEKDLYDYQKKVEEQTSEISSLEKQLSAYSGDDSEETRATVQSLKVQLEEARSDLEEMQYDQYISDQKALLDSLFEEYQSILNARLDDIDLLLSDMITEINSGSSDINETLTAVGESVGYNLSNSMSTIWGETNASGVVTSVNTQIQTSTTSINTALGNVKTAIENAQTQSDTQAETEVENLNTANSDTASSTLSDSAQGTANTTATTTASTTASSSSSTGTKTSSSSSSTQGDGKIQVGDKVTYNSGKYYYDSYGSSPTGTKNKGKKVYITKVVSNPKSGQNYPIAISTGKKLGDGDLGWVKKSQLKGYATGLRQETDDEWALTQEKGAEAIVKNGMVFTPLGPGDAVLNADATKNFYDMMTDPSKFIKDGISASNVANAVNSTNNTVNSTMSIELNLPNVTNYEELKYELQHDKSFEEMIQAMTIQQLFGGSVLKKYKY